jgi:hypothetical protein
MAYGRLRRPCVVGKEILKKGGITPLWQRGESGDFKNGSMQI